MSHLLDPITADNPRPAAPGLDAAKKPTSAARQAASRANGRKSRGPVTPEGKARSSQNAIKHGLLARALVLEQEDPEVFEAFARELHDYLRPTNPIARMLVDDLVAAHWRRTRIRRIEAETWNIGIEEHLPNSIGVQHAAALAFRELSDATPALHLLNRYERGYDRQIARTLRLLPKWNQPDEEVPQAGPSHPTDDGGDAHPAAAGPPACACEIREPIDETPPTDAHAAVAEAEPDLEAAPENQDAAPSASQSDPHPPIPIQTPQKMPNEPGCPTFSTTPHAPPDEFGPRRAA